MSLKEIAQRLITGEITLDQIEAKYDFKKGKSLADFNAALTRGIKNGMGKTELEIECVATNLGKVLVKKK